MTTVPPSLPETPTPPPAQRLPTPTVVAVLVAHDGASYLPRTLAALAAQSRRPDVVVAVDTGSTDGTSELLAASELVDRVVTAPQDTGFAAAVFLGLAEVKAPMDWIWVLHDDSAPGRDCLGELLRAAAASPSLALVGPKVLGWDDPRRLLEVGVTLSGSGRRETGLERREQDQGQHDGQRDVLAVGSAGSLVRWSVWEELGGYDPALVLFREDVDLGWRANRAGHRVAVVTDATLVHAEATARRRRDVSGHLRPHFVDRSSALLVLLGNGRGWALPLQWLRLAVGTLLRALGFLLAKAPALAGDEIRAFGQVLLRPQRVLAARRLRRSAPHAVPPSQLRAFFPRPGAQLRHGAETLSAVLAARVPVEESAPVGGGLLETGPSDEDTESMGGGSGWWRRRLRRPGVLLTLALLLLAVLAWRSLFGGGSLFGGALLPVPSGVSDLWASFTAAWHPVATGSAAASPPYLAPLAALAVPLLGKAALAVTLLLALAVPLAGIGAYQAMRGLTLSRRLHVWVAAAYALSPALLAGVAQGRLGTVVVAVLLPWLGIAVTRAVGDAEHPGRWSAAAAGALLLAVIMAFAPFVWWLAAVLAVVAGVVWATDRATRVRLAGVVLLPWALLLPWSLRLVTDPATNLLEAGVPLPRAHGFAPWQVLLFVPGGPGSAPLLLGGVLTVVALVSILRLRRHPVVAAGLVVLVVGMLGALLTATVTVTPQASASAVAPWPGPSLVVATAGLLLAAAVAVRGARWRLASAQFGWRQPATLALAGVVALSTVALAGWWLVRGADGPLLRGDPQVLPAFVAAAADEPERVRTLVLQPDGGALRYSLLRSANPQIGDAETAPPASQLSGLDAAVAEVTSGRGGPAVDDLRRYAVRYVLVSAPVDPVLESTLDSVPGLVRVANPGSDGLWRIEEPTARLSLVTPATGTGTSGKDPGQQDTVTLLPSGAVDATAAVPAGPDDRTLLLAENADKNWSAELAGRTLSGRAQDWEQVFDVPGAAGTLTLTYDSTPRTLWLLLEGLVLVVVAVLAVPGRRNDAEEDQ